MKVIRMQHAGNGILTGCIAGNRIPLKK